jgi:hypothetical protein
MRCTSRSRWRCSRDRQVVTAELNGRRPAKSSRTSKSLKPVAGRRQRPTAVAHRNQEEILSGRQCGCTSEINSRRTTGWIR